MVRKSGKGEDVKRNTIRILQALQKLVDGNLSSPDARVWVEWINCETLHVTGKPQEKTGKGSKYQGTTKLDLVRLVERSGDRIELAKHKCESFDSQEEKQKDAVQSVIDQLRYLKLFTDKSKNKNKGYWIFDLALSPTQADNIPDFIDSIWERTDHQQQPESQQPTQLISEQVERQQPELQQYISPERLERVKRLGDLPGQPDDHTPSDSEQLLNSTLLYDMVIQLDFKKEIQLFQQVIYEYKTAGFLIRGNNWCGHQVCTFFVDRLLRLKDGWKNNAPIEIDLNVNFRSRDPSKLWTILAKQFRLQDPAPKNILETVCDNLPKQDIIFIFYGVDDMGVGGLLSEWIQKFWAPLVEMTKDMSARETHLLMFLVAERGSSIIDLEVSVAYKFDQPEYPRLPLLLPLADKFEKKDLEDWTTLVRGFSELVRPGLTADYLLTRSKGFLNIVYQEIYRYYGITF